jgi:hypothetical protein
MALLTHFLAHEMESLQYGHFLLVVVMLGFYISVTLVKILQCRPRARIFDKSIPGHCIKFVSMSVHDFFPPKRLTRSSVSALPSASGLFNTITDYIILLLSTVTRMSHRA